MATFEVTSVAKLVPTMTMRTRIRESRKSRTASCDPIHADNPETCVALARAKPPPRRSTSDHGIRSWITCHRSRPGEGAAERNSAMENGEGGREGRRDGVRGGTQRFFFCGLERIAMLCYDFRRPPAETGHNETATEPLEEKFPGHKEKILFIGFII